MIKMDDRPSLLLFLFLYRADAEVAHKSQRFIRSFQNIFIQVNRGMSKISVLTGSDE